MSRSAFIFAEIVFFFSERGVFFLCFFFAQTRWEDWLRYATLVFAEYKLLIKSNERKWYTCTSVHWLFLIVSRTYTAIVREVIKSPN